MTNQTPPSPRRHTKLYKDPIDKKIGGVASGVAKYFDIDTTLVRAIWAAAVLVGGFGLVLYLVLWFILDDDPEALAGLAQPTPVEPVVVDEPAEEITPAEAAFETTEETVEAESVEAATEETVTDG